MVAIFSQLTSMFALSLLVVAFLQLPYAHGFDSGHHHDDHQEVILTCRGDVGANIVSINVKHKQYSAWFSQMGLAKYGPGLEATINVFIKSTADQARNISVILTELLSPDCSLTGLGHLVEPRGFLGYGGYGHGGYGYDDSHPGHNYGFDVEHAQPIPGVLTTVTGTPDDGPVANIDCYVAGQPEMFQGEISVTASGKTCETWLEWEYDADGFTDEELPSNFCRVPFGDGEASPWCYSPRGVGMDTISWETCDVPVCVEAPGKASSIYIDGLYGFKSLSELAGRGVVLCPTEQVKSDGHGHYVCDPATDTETAPSCCSLEYADKEQFYAP